MLQVARPRAEQARAGLVLADAVTLPLAGGCLDAIFAAGLLSHLPDPLLALSELARVSREHAVLVLFHPIGRAALARKHGRELTAEDTQAEPVLTDLLARSGWHLDGYDDGAGRFLAVARRRTDTGPDRAATAAGQAHQHG
jgi:SAM-dependent methyltransferase